jgi:hypothetical protein
MRKTSVLVAFVMATVAWAGFASPASGQYVNTLVCGFSTVEPGDTVSVSGDGFDPGSQITVSITDEALPSYTLGGAGVSGAFARTVLVTPADATGNFSATFTIPADTPDGNYNVLAVGVQSEGQPRALACPVEVISDTSPIAFTGSNTRPMVQIALAIVALGALLVFATRRKSDDELPVGTGV